MAALVALGRVLHQDFFRAHQDGVVLDRESGDAEHGQGIRKRGPVDIDPAVRLEVRIQHDAGDALFDAAVVLDRQVIGSQAPVGKLDDGLDRLVLGPIAFDVSRADFREIDVHVALGIHVEGHLVRFLQIGIRSLLALHQGFVVEVRIRHGRATRIGP
jgi:hypothetical protein